MVKAKHDTPPMRMTVEKTGLVPASQYDAERLSLYRYGTTILCSVTQDRNAKLLRKYWAIIGKVISDCPTPWNDKEQASDALKLSLGMVNTFKRVDGKWGYSPRSLTELDGPEFEEFFEQAMAVLQRITGVDPVNLGKEAADTGSQGFSDEQEQPDAPQDAESDNASHGTPESQTQTQEPSSVESPAPRSADVGSQEALSPASAPDNSKSAAAGSEPESSAQEKQTSGPDAALDSAPEGALKLSLVECVQKCIGIVTDRDLTPEERRGNLEQANGPWKKELPRNLDQVSVIFRTADKVLKGELELKPAKEYLAGCLKLDVEELG